jgi:hypothetical protein
MQKFRRVVQQIESVEIPGRLLDETEERYMVEYVHKQFV